MIVIIEKKVAVNGRHFAELAHRNPIHDANHIHVEGDVSVKSIKEY